MSVLRRKLGRDLYASKGMLAGITSILAVGVICFVAMRALYHDLRGAQQSYYNRCRMADFWIDLKKAPVTELERLAQLPGIAELRTRIQFLATVDLPSSGKPLNGLVLSMPNRRAPVINDLVLRRGSYFTEQRDAEVIVSDAFARANQVRPGDTIHLILNNRRQELLVVGTAISSEFVYLMDPGSIIPDPEHFGVFYVKRTFAEDAFAAGGAANQVIGLLTPAGRRTVDALLERVERTLEPYGVVSTVPRRLQVSHQFLDAEIQGLGVFATIMPAIFLSVAAVVLNVLLSRIIDQQRTVIGTLKALGYGARQVFWHYLQFGLIIGTAGGVLGCLGGYALAHGMVEMYKQFYEFPQLSTRVYPGIWLLGVAIGVACAVVGSCRGARAAVRLGPAEAMRPRSPRQGGRIWLERFGWFWGRLTLPWRVALRNVVRNWIRTAVGVFAAAMGASLLVVGFMSLEAMWFLVDFQYAKISRADLEVTFESMRGEAAIDEFRRLPAVAAVEPVLRVAGTLSSGIERRKGTVTGLTSGARLTRPRDLAGRPLRIPTGGLLLTRKMAQLLDVMVGDTLALRPARGLRREVQVPVAEIAESYLGTSIYTDWDYLCGLIGETKAVSGVQVALDADPDRQAALYRRIKQLPAIESTMVRADTVRSFQETMLESQNTSIAILVSFAGVIFFGSVLNTSLVSMAERLREIATLRVLGYGAWEIGGLFLRENMLVNLLGTAIGLPLGWLQYQGMAAVYDMELIRLPVVTAPWIWATTVALAIVFALASQLVVQWKIHHLEWLDALQVKE